MRKVRGYVIEGKEGASGVDAAVPSLVGTDEMVEKDALKGKVLSLVMFSLELDSSFAESSGW